MSGCRTTAQRTFGAGGNSRLSTYALTRRNRRGRTDDLQVVVEADFSSGIVKDAPRSSILAGGLYDCADFLLDQPGVARERGGTSYSGAALGANNYAASTYYMDFSTGAKLIGIADDNHLYEVAGTTTDRATLGAAFLPICKHCQVGDLVALPSNDGTTAIKKAYVSSGTLTAAAWGGSPPAGTIVESYYSRLALAGNAALPRRIYFSPTPTVEAAWDTANAYVDAEHNVTALCALQGALLVFSAGFCERLSGTTPPPDSDMQITTIESLGCVDARSVSTYRDACVFANLNGVYLTNGVSFDCLTERADGSGIGSYWRANVASGYSFAGEVIDSRDTYVISVMNGATLIFTLSCHIPTRRWTRLTNVKALGFTNNHGPVVGLHYADRASARVIDLAGIWAKAAGNKNDANGTAVAGLLEYRMIGQGIGLKAYLDGRVTYDMRDAGSDNPTMAVQIAPGIEATTYAAVGESPLTETSDATRARVTLAKDSQALNVKLIRANASSRCEVYGLECEVRSYPAQADGV